MSAPPLNRIIKFLLIAAGLIIILSVLWIFIEPGYSGFLSGISDSLAPDEYRIELRNGNIYFTQQYFIDNVNGKSVRVDLPKDYPARVSISASAIQFGLLLTVALVASTPGLIWRKRILYSLIAALITFLLQLLSVVIVARTFSTVFFVVVSDLVPPLLWAVFSFRYWFPSTIKIPAGPAAKPGLSGKKKA